MNLIIKIKKTTLYLWQLTKICWLPITLVVIFVIQNHLFNSFVKIPIHDYFFRRTFVTASFGTIFFGLAIFLKNPFRHIYLFATSIFVSAIFIVQFLYYSYAEAFLQTSALFYAGEGMSILSTVKILLTYRLVFFIIGPIVVALSWILTYRNVIIEKKLTKNQKISATIAILFFTTFGYSYLFIHEYIDAGNIVHIYQYNKLYDVNALESKLGIINFSLGDALTLGFKTDKATAAEMSFVKDYNNQQKITTTSTLNFGLLKGRNLIFIQVESLENAVIGQKINDQEITPNLNKLIKDGLYFDTYYSPIGPGTTADAEFMALNSLYSLSNTVAFIQYANNHYTALPGLLKENGYHTYALHGDVPSFWNRANIYPQLGYEKWFGRQDYNIPREIGPYDLGDKDFFEQSIPKLKAIPQPFMATLITLTSHTPFELPPDLNTLNFSSTTTLNLLQQNYLQSVRYTDQAIGDFIENLKSANLYNNSLILIYGDHGSFTKISSALKFNNSVFKDLQTTEVPMIILAPDTALKGVRHTPASHLDVYPTVANLLGLNVPLDIFGHDMIAVDKAEAISRNLLSGTISSIITAKLAYHSAVNGKFENGVCLELPSKKNLPIDRCRSLYIEKENAVKASDLMVKRNLVGVR